MDRGVAQSGSASALGAEGRRFESCLPDHSGDEKEVTEDRNSGDEPKSKENPSKPACYPAATPSNVGDPDDSRAKHSDGDQEGYKHKLISY